MRSRKSIFRFLHLARAQRGLFRLLSQQGAQNGPRSPCYAYCRSRGGCRPSTTAEVCVLHVVQEKSGVGAWRLEVALWRRPDEGWHVRNTEKMVAMPPDPAAVSARTLRESCLPGRCGPRAAPIIETRRDLNPRDRRKLGEKPRQALRKRKAQAPCERRPSRVRIHIAAWFHRP